MVILSAGSFRSEQPECSWAVWAQNVIGVFGIELLRGLHPLATKPEIIHGFLNRDVSNENLTKQRQFDQKLKMHVL